MSLVALSAGILNTWKRFAVPAATPVLLNLSAIAAAWALAPQLGRHRADLRAAVGVMLGGVLQLACRCRRCCASAAAAHRPDARGLRAAFAHPGVRGVLRQMAPALLGVSVAQLSLLINTQIALHQGWARCPG